VVNREERTVKDTRPRNFLITKMDIRFIMHGTFNIVYGKKPILINKRFNSSSGDN
jgi:hypothetical protein